MRPFPEVTSGHWQVSTGGGTRPLWSHDGKELFYVSPMGALMRIGVEPRRSWSATTPIGVIKDGYFTIPAGNQGRTYDVSADGRRFLMIKDSGSADPAAAPSSLIVVQNWSQELKRLVPTK